MHLHTYTYLCCIHADMDTHMRPWTSTHTLHKMHTFPSLFLMKIPPFARFSKPREPPFFRPSFFFFMIAKLTSPSIHHKDEVECLESPKSCTPVSSSLATGGPEERKPRFSSAIGGGAVSWPLDPPPVPQTALKEGGSEFGFRNQGWGFWTSPKIVSGLNGK